MLLVEDASAPSDYSPTADTIHETISGVCAMLDAVGNTWQLSTFQIEEAQFNIGVMENMLQCHTDDGIPIPELFPAGQYPCLSVWSATHFVKRTAI